MPRLFRALAPILVAVTLGVGLLGAPAEAASKPVFTSMSATAGPIAGGRTITISGKYFTKTSKVMFGSTSASSVKYSSSTKLTVVTPKHADGPVDVRVTTSGGTSSIATNGVFTYRKVPVISSVTPSAGPITGGSTVTVDGLYFTSSTKVRFGSHYSTLVTKVSSTRLMVKVPSHSAGSFHVWAKSSGGTSTVDGPLYTYGGAPAVTSLSTEQGSASGGTKVTIRGASFTPDTQVLFDTTKATSVTVTSPTQLTAVTPKHTIKRVQVTVKTPAGTSKSSSATSYQFGSDEQLRLAIGSFNVRVGSGYDSSRGPNEKPWTQRVPVVVSQIKREGLDVIGVQEASASTKYTASKKVAQFQDLADRLGSPYKLTETDRYCYDSDKAGNCTTGASSSDRIIYNSDRLTMLDSGTRKLDTRAPTDGSGRYVVWATFTDKRTDKKFFFVNTHLEPNKGDALYGAVREAQTRIILDEVATENTGGLPTIFTGDLATSKFDKQTPANIAHDMLIDAGFVDPLVNTFKYKGTQTLVDSLVNTRFNSLNYFEPAPLTVHESYPIGSYVDYILVRGGFEFSAWHTVLDVDSAGRFAGVIPSDHNLITLTLRLL